MSFTFAYYDNPKLDMEILLIITSQGAELNGNKALKQPRFN